MRTPSKVDLLKSVQPAPGARATCVHASGALWVLLHMIPRST